MGKQGLLTKLELYAATVTPNDHHGVLWWRFCRLWVRIALVMATTQCERWNAVLDESLAGRRDVPDGLRGPRDDDDERAHRKALVEAGCHGR